jgi:hypothetical protein
MIISSNYDINNFDDDDDDDVDDDDDNHASIQINCIILSYWL